MRVRAKERTPGAWRGRRRKHIAHGRIGCGTSRRGTRRQQDGLRRRCSRAREAKQLHHQNTAGLLNRAGGDGIILAPTQETSKAGRVSYEVRTT
jgi:hypothetical protein